MSPTWDSEKPPESARIPPMGWLLVALRGLALTLLVFGSLLVLLLMRLIERPLFGPRRPVTPFITQFVCRNAFRILNMRFVTRGTLMRQPGAVVANHSSWLDIFALNARKRVYFVSKAEVAGWPGIGWLARATGTVFIERNPRRAREHNSLLQARLLAGHKLLFFPEGTSSDGCRVLPFKTTLFEAFLTPELRQVMHIQPVSVVYHAPKGQSPRYYGWWGDMALAPHLIKTLATPVQGSVELIYHPPVRVSDFADRKTLAAVLENTVRQGHRAALLQA